MLQASHPMSLIIDPTTCRIPIGPFIPPHQHQVAWLQEAWITVPGKLWLRGFYTHPLSLSPKPWTRRATDEHGEFQLEALIKLPPVI